LFSGTDFKKVRERSDWRTLLNGSGVASPEIWGGPKCLILGKQHYFVWKNASQGTK